ncbi:MAG: hypothetical protein HY268_23400 [Deltaproteobacteria bacterium]|nr:hypothetical protein [Deltaproteobacteria bacterium]
MADTRQDLSPNLPDLLNDCLLPGEEVLYRAHKADRAKIRLIITDQRVLGILGKKAKHKVFSLSLLEIKKVAIKSEKVFGPWVIVISDIYGQSARFNKLEKPGLIRFIIFQALQDRKEFGIESPHLQLETKQAIKMAIGASQIPEVPSGGHMWAQLMTPASYEN